VVDPAPGRRSSPKFQRGHNGFFSAKRNSDLRDTSCAAIASPCTTRPSVWASGGGGGAGNTAMDACRVALRMAPEQVSAYPRTRRESPARTGTLEHAIEERRRVPLADGAHRDCGRCLRLGHGQLCRRIKGAGRPDASGTGRRARAGGRPESSADLWITVISCPWEPRPTPSCPDHPGTLKGQPVGLHRNRYEAHPP